MDSVAYKAIKTFFDAKNIGLQLIDLLNHHVNATKCAIKTCKDHLTGLCVTDQQFPL